MPPAIAAVIPITRGSRRASATSAVPKTSVYCGGALAVMRRLFGPARACDVRAAVLDRARLGRVPLLHALEAALLGRSEALSLHGLDVDDDRALGLQRLPQRLPQRLDVVAVDHAHVGEVELLEEEAGRPERLQATPSAAGPSRSIRLPIPAGSLVRPASTASRAA